MWFRQLFAPAGSGSRRRDRARTPNDQPKCRLGCESLEDRAVPASLSVGDVVVTEGDTGTRTAVATVRLSAPVNKTVTVSYRTANETAVAGRDYVATSGTITFARGETTRSIVVPVKGDRVAEPDETFAINLSRAKNATIHDGPGIVSILDNEPRFNISSASVVEGNAGTTLMTFTVTLGNAYDQTATVNVATQDGTATVADGDYLAAAAMLTFAPGETTKEFSVVVNGDTAPEPDSAFVVNLSNASANASIVQSQSLGYIGDDDSPVIEPDYGYYDYGYDSGWWYGYWSNSNTGPGEYYY